MVPLVLILHPQYLALINDCRMNELMMKRDSEQLWVSVLTKPKHTWEAPPLEDLCVYSRMGGAGVEETCFEFYMLSLICWWNAQDEISSRQMLR